MTELHILQELVTYLDRTFPDDYDTHVQKVGGQIIVLTDTNEVALDQWCGGVLEFTSGPCVGMSFVIAQSEAETLWLGTPFMTRKPQEGDTVTLKGGPLAVARVFIEDPESVKQAVEDGISFFIVMDTVSGNDYWRALGGRTHKGVEAKSHTYAFEVSVETKHITGMATEREMYNAFVAIPILREQVATLVHAFRTQTQSRMSGEGGIHWGKVLVQRPGQELMRGFVLEFDVKVN